METGNTSAAKFVPQRGANREGFACPTQVGTRRPSSAAAIARCSAPCRKSVRPRSIHAIRTTPIAIPTGNDADCGRKMRDSGASIAASKNTRSRRRATPRPRKSGVSARPSRTIPRRSGTRRTKRGGAGIAPSWTTPSRLANAQKRSLAITTPSARAIPPSLGRSGSWSARARTLRIRARSTRTGSRAGGRPARAGRPTSANRWAYLPAAAAEEAEQQQHENDDQDDPEDRHEVVPLSSFHQNGEPAHLGTQSPKIRLTLP